jgi:dipeptidyl aminopeptidase/acylaminoacyl peptidase
LAFGPLAAAAEPPDRETMYRRYLEIRSRLRGGSVEGRFTPDGTAFVYLDGVPERAAMHRVDEAGRGPFLDPEGVRRQLAVLLGHEPPYAGLPFSSFDFVREKEADAIRFEVEGKAFLYELGTQTVVTSPSRLEEDRRRRAPRVVRTAFRATQADVLEVPSPDGRSLAGEREFNLWLRSSVDGRAEPLTTDGVKDYAWDVEGSRFAPNGLRLAATKVDSRHVGLLPIVHWLKTVEEVEWARYTKAGGALPVTELHVVDVLSKQAVRVDTGKGTDQFIFILGWRRDGSEVLFLRVERELKRLDLMAADPKTGASRIVLTETQKTFVEALPWNFRFGVEEYKLLATFLADDRRLVWMSERDGFSHLYLYSLDGTLIRRLTRGAFPVTQVLAVDAEAGSVYFTAHGEAHPYETHLYRVGLDGQGQSRLTEGSGQHRIVFAPSRKFFLDTHSSFERPPRVELRRANGKRVEVLSEASTDALAELRYAPPEEFGVKAADGRTDLYGVLYKPHDFDASRRYPVLEHIYGGPQTTWVEREFVGPLSVLPHALAQLGFVVFVVDARGTPERGKAFQDVVYGNFGRNEIPDHVAALQQLAAQRRYLDTTRVGVFGGSWGGYMTLRALLLAPDVYHVGVATYPVADLLDHRAGPIEPFMGLPHSNPAGYAYASNLDRTSSLKGKLLLVHGTSDVNATFSATMKMVEALTRAGKPYDLVVLPEQTHRLSGEHREYYLERLRRYFVEHLRP